MKKIICLIPVLFILFSTLQAQNYKTAVGARLGYPLSASIKHFINDSHAVEAYVGTRGRFDYRFTSISAAYQIHKPLSIDGFDGLSWYYGFGGSVYFWSWDDQYSFYANEFNGTSFGIQGYLGLDYKFENIPLSLTVDWVPSFFINGFGSGFGGGYGALGVRYVLK